MTEKSSGTAPSRRSTIPAIPMSTSSSTAAPPARSRCRSARIEAKSLTWRARRLASSVRNAAPCTPNASAAARAAGRATASHRERLADAGAPVELARATSIPDIAASPDREDRPQIVVIDSIQTMYLDTLDSGPGTVSQVRAAAQELIRLAKRRGFTVILVGHVTKEGVIAGPRVLEHMVDTVLYFEGERGHQFRILRAVKNRFGPTDEIGVFEMTDAGLAEVPNPSALFLAERSHDVSGAAIFAGMEGTPPVLVEIQALVAPSPLAPPPRAAR